MEERKTDIEYFEFLKKKIAIAPDFGHDKVKRKLPDILLSHQKDVVIWSIKGGRRAIFITFGMGKTIIQLSCSSSASIKYLITGIC